MSDQNEDGRRKVIELIETMDVAMLTTTTTRGAALRARPMAYRQVEGGGVIWFFTKRDSKKVAELTECGDVLVTFSEPKTGVFVTVAGHAEMIDERSRVEALWSEVYRIWFRGGAQDDNFVLLGVEPQRAEYWDTPTNTMVYAFGYLRALSTGKPLRAGKIGSVEKM